MRLRCLGTNQQTPRRGAAAVEMAFILPIFMMMVFGMIEVGRMLMVQQILVNAARAGARQAILVGSTDTVVQTTIASYMTAAAITGYSYTISPDLSTTPGSGTAITVKVSVPWSAVTWTGFLTPEYFSATTIVGTVVMVHE